MFHFRLTGELLTNFHNSIAHFCIVFPNFTIPRNVLVVFYVHVVYSFNASRSQKIESVWLFKNHFDKLRLHSYSTAEWHRRIGVLLRTFDIGALLLHDIYVIPWPPRRFFFLEKTLLRRQHTDNIRGTTKISTKPKEKPHEFWCLGFLCIKRTIKTNLSVDKNCEIKIDMKKTGDIHETKIKNNLVSLG